MAEKTAKNPKGAGRKKLIIDYKKLEEIGGKGLSEAQIASVLGISWDTLSSCLLYTSPSPRDS